MALKLRPPVVTIMGHVDHGKTSLLDAIRKSSLAAHESGGITQHIGAYQVTHNGKTITFIDTPGHAAFSKMRSRGAAVTDFVVLVVSATEGVKPQTVESIQHIKAAGVQYLVAITKMDLPEANPELIKAQLTEHEVFVEGYGGDIVAVPVSAKTGDGLDKLLEMIALLAEMAELKADPDAAFEAAVIESKMDAQRGSVATILVKQGTVHVGDVIYAENTSAKVKALQDENGKRVVEAGPSTPVEVLGWEKTPTIGSAVKSVKFLPKIVVPKQPEKPAAAITPAEGEAAIVPPAETGPKPTLKIILKSDVEGTLEALQQALAADEIEILSAGVGDISEKDVLLAESTQSLILGFKVKAPSAVKKLAETLQVKLKIYDIIYDLIEDVQKQVLKLIEPTIDEEELGVADVIAVFDIKGDRIAGCRVKSGEIAKNHLYHIKRADKIIGDPRIKAFKRGKEDIEVAKAGTECGISFRNFSDIEIGDQITSYRVKDE
jgi:translation initiation factor IF-2